MRYVTYEQFGAKGDGVTDDMPAIVAAHAYANEHNLPVRTTADAHYYIGGVKPETVDTYEAKFPYKPCRKMIVKNLTSASGKKWKLCQNPLLKPAEEVVEE